MEKSDDNKLRNIVDKAVDLVKLNLLTLLCCIPVVTAGAAITAMDYVLLKIVRNEEGYISKAFFQSFRENLKDSLKIWLPALAVFALLSLNFYWNRESTNSQFLQILILFLGAVFSGYMIYTLAGLSRYKNPVKKTVRNGLLMEFYYFPQTLLILAVCVGAGILLVTHFLYLFPFFLLFGLSLPGIFIMWIMSGIFEKIEAEK